VLDLLTADGFEARAGQVIDDQAEQLVLDLSGLLFLDCRGSRALAAVTRAVPEECPVVVRSARPAVRRLLGLLGLDLETRHGEAGAGPAQRPAVRAWSAAR
jgi:anti-anti-sigma regulatory factor